MHVKQALYTLGGALGGGVGGLLFAVLGVLAGADARTTFGIALVAGALAFAVWEAGGRRARLLQLDQETPQRWLHLGPNRWALRNGVSLGFAATTRIGFPLWYVLPITSFVAGNLWFGPLLWGTYGIARTSLAWFMLHVMRHRRPDSVLDELIRLQPRVRRAAGGLLALDCVAFLALAVLSSGESSSRGAASAPRADSTVACSARAEPSPSEGLREGEGVVVSAARLEGGGRFALYSFDDPPARTRIGGRRTWLWKTPVSLTADRSVVLSVHARSVGTARLVFARQPKSFTAADRATRFRSCTADEPQFSGAGTVGPATGWGGSIVTLERRQCLRLQVVAGGRRSTLRVPLGRRCP